MLKSNYFHFIISFVLLILLQVLVLNRISFLGYATPFFYIYFLLKLPINANRSLVTFLGFLLGFIIDIFCNTPGINAAASTLTAFLVRPVQGLFFVRDDYNGQIPSLSLLKVAFVKYAVILTLIHHMVLVCIESFSLFNIQLVALRVLFSTLLTFLLIFAFEGFSTKNKKSWQKTT